MNESKSVALSHKGRRDYNQDSCAVIKSGKLTFLAVADGMGGHNGGEIASQTVIETCKSVIHKAAENNPGPDTLKSILEELFEESQQNLFKLADKDASLTGMGTTLSCVLLLDDCYVWGNIGDSRVYHFNGSRLKQITVDHSYLEEYRREYGNDIPDYIAARSNVITKSLSGDDDKPDIFPAGQPYEKIKWDEGFLICSDGLIPDKLDACTNWMTDIISTYEDLEDAAENLISHAYNNGSDDNISLVLYEHMDFERVKLENSTGKPKDRTKEGSDTRNFKNRMESRRQKNLIHAFWLIIIFLILAGASLFYFFGPYDIEIKKKDTTGQPSEEYIDTN